MTQDRQPSNYAHSYSPSDEVQLVGALRRGDEAAFAELVERYHGSMLRLAMVFTGNQDTAGDVIQETWLGVLKGIGSFEGRSSLKTWIFRILTNRAKTQAQREGRSIPFSALWDPESDVDEPAVELDRFQTFADEHPGGWVAFPASWESVPEQYWLSREARAVIQGAIDALPPGQREVITLRDVEGWASDEVCNVLGVSETNQRVLLHRARSKVRRALERYLNVERGLVAT
jgi:RNA polymerase sigma-70 factor (ECF subfamily)